jgi:hypothetical protein
MASRRSQGGCGPSLGSFLDMSLDMSLDMLGAELESLSSGTEDLVPEGSPEPP